MKPPRTVLTVAAIVVLALMAVFAVQIQRSQSESRQDVEERFRERAEVSAALTASIFESTSGSSQPENAKTFGGAGVEDATLTARAKEGNLQYLVLLDASGGVIAASSGTPVTTLRALRNRPTHIERVLSGSTYALSNATSAGGPLEYAQPIPTARGKRVLVSGFPPALIHAFLSGYLTQVPNTAGGRAYVLDGNGVVVGSPVKSAVPGLRPDDEGLVGSLLTRAEGRYGRGRYFTTSAVGNSPWRVVVTAPEASLFEAVRGARKWVPWILLAGFGLAACGILILIRRVLLGADQLAVANRRLGETNETLEQRARELSRSNAELEQFASIASHDLREPLRKVQMFAAQLEVKEGDRLTEDGRGYLRRMSRAGERMQMLIDDLLKFSRVATHAQPFVDVDLETVVRESIDDLEAVVAESGGTVHVGDLPVVRADQAQMRQLMQNLLSNALKFRRDGVPPEVRVDGRVRDRFVEISVSDNGIGFDPRYASRIFRVFERLHGRDAYPGTGIGLALCRKIAERHGGGITAESVPNEGSTFTFSIPVDQAIGTTSATAASRPGTEREEAPVAHA